MNKERFKRGDLIRFEDPVTNGEWQHGQVVKARNGRVECVIEESFRDHGRSIVTTPSKRIYMASDNRLSKLPDPSHLGE